MHREVPIAVAEATHHVFRSVLGGSIEPICDSAADSVEFPEGTLTALISLTADQSTTIVLTMAPDVAMAIVEGMLGVRPNAIDDDVADAVGEVANMVAGAAKARLNCAGSSIGLPLLLDGDGIRVSPSSPAETHQTWYRTSAGVVRVRLIAADVDQERLRKSGALTVS